MPRPRPLCSEFRTPRRRGASAIVGWLLGLLSAGCDPQIPSEISGPLEQHAYVWQREWTSNVVHSVTQFGPRFASLIALGGEIDWPSGRPRLTRVEWNPEALRHPGCPIGLALRLGPFAGPFDTNGYAGKFVLRTARESVDDARRAGLSPTEFQIDFDCAESRLDGYRVWIEALRRELAPLPVVFTALPSWLDRRSFARLARAADGFVLQVHSVARPRHVTAPFELCDPAAARRWVDEAARLGRPFRVALPTYAYLAAFDRDGNFLGASAEGPLAERPPGTRFRELGADPRALAQLMADWTARRPTSMTGVIWYRLPVAGDRLNWRWPTLARVMSGRFPEHHLVVTPRNPDPGLIEVRLDNDGSGPYVGPVSIRAGWTEGRLLGHDGLLGFSASRDAAGSLVFSNAICRLPPGDGATIGWLRFDTDRPAHLELLLPTTPPRP